MFQVVEAARADVTWSCGPSKDGSERRLTGLSFVCPLSCNALLFDVRKLDECVQCQTAGTAFEPSVNGIMDVLITSASATLTAGVGMWLEML